MCSVFILQQVCSNIMLLSDQQNSIQASEPSFFGNLLLAPFGMINDYCRRQFYQQTKTDTLFMLLCIHHFYDSPLLLLTNSCFAL